MGVLDGLRVVQVGSHLPSLLATMLLADEGADVLHLERPGTAPLGQGSDAVLRRGTRTAVVDFASAAARRAAMRRVRAADVVVEGLRPGSAGQLALHLANLRAQNPRLVTCSLPGFASEDPRAAVPGWDGVVAAATGCHWRDGQEHPSFTALPIPSCYAGITAALAIVMALIARERDGFGQHVEVALFDATFLAVGASGLLVDGRPGGGRPEDPWGGAFRCADGRWIRLSLATPRFRRRFLEAVGRPEWGESGPLRPDSPDRVDHDRRMRDLFAGRTAAEWEQFGRRIDVPLTLVRTRAEWLACAHAHDAGVVVDIDDPVLGRVRQAGPALRLLGEPGRIRGPRAAATSLPDWRPEPGRRLPADVPPAAPALEGIRVLDVTQVLAGPTAARTLAEFGAQVVKINNPGEEGAGYRWNVHRYHSDVNRGKATALVDLKHPAGREAVQRLLAQADVVVQNFRLGVAERLGVGLAQAQAARPDVVYASVGAFARHGEWEGAPGYEPNAQAASGMMARGGGRGRPQMEPYAVNDYATGLLGALAIGLALLHRRRTGRGQAVEVSLDRTATVLQAVYLRSTQRAPDPRVPEGPGAFGWGPLQRLYRAADGWFYLGAGRTQVKRLGAVAGVELTRLDDVEIEQCLERSFRQRGRDAWVRALWEAGIGAHRVVSPLEIMLDPCVVARGLSLTSDHVSGARITTVGPPARLSRTPVRPGRAAPPPGADAAAVLASAGMADRLDELVANGVVALG